MILNVAVINGDGVGTEMMKPAIKVLECICKQYGHELELKYVIASGEAIDAFNDPIPEEALKTCLWASAVLFGNTGLSKYQNNPMDKRPEYALMELRKAIGVTTNIRPVFIYPELFDLSPLDNRIIKKGVDFVFVRDLAGGIYHSENINAVGKYGFEAYEYEYYNEMIVENTAKIAFDIASTRKKKVYNLDKANVLGSSKLWRNTVIEVAKQYPDVDLEHCYIDTAAMKIIVEPEAFDVIVTSNVFGDIIADEGTQITGTQYLYSSAEIRSDGKGLYTPNQLHHPDESIIGKQIVNPIGMIASVALMLELTFGLDEEARKIENAIKEVISRGYRTKDIAVEGEKWLTTDEIGDIIIEVIEE